MPYLEGCSQQNSYDTYDQLVDMRDEIVNEKMIDYHNNLANRLPL